ncbi:MAG: disulfide bond formation protein DsbA [Actinomycetota bacterium]
MTARWVVDEVQPQRDVRITWQPISLLEKNQPPKDSPYYERSFQTHRYLRVMESLRAAEGDGPVQAFYWELGRRIHHDGNVAFDPAEALAAAGLATGHAEAFDDESWDAEIGKRMKVGLDLAGDDVGTPLIALDDDNGDRVALFGPVITRVPTSELSLRLWDGLVACATVPGFWELKRTRTERPEFGDRP